MLLLCPVMALTVLSCALTEPIPPSPTRGADSREALVGAYLEAIAARNSSALIALTDPVVDARADVAALVESRGGSSLRSPAIGWRDEFGGIYVVANVTGTDTTSGRPQQLEIPISGQNGRFYLALGSAPNQSGNAVTSSPSPRSYPYIFEVLLEEQLGGRRFLDGTGAPASKCAEPRC